MDSGSLAGRVAFYDMFSGGEAFFFSKIMHKGHTHPLYPKEGSSNISDGIGDGVGMKAHQTLTPPSSFFLPSRGRVCELGWGWGEGRQAGGMAFLL